MLPNCFLVFILTAQICWSCIVFPWDEQIKLPKVMSQKDVGKALFLTSLIQTNQTKLARSYSLVENVWTDERIYSYSGYFTVNASYNSNLFFWFFRKSGQNWQKAPVLLWLQGGPGRTSMIGLFNENGPFVVTEDGVKHRQYAWTDKYNVIYIDQPVGAGFSFTRHIKGFIGTVQEAVEHLYNALTQFFQLFPQLRSNEFYITGEAYASKFIIPLSYKIHSFKMNGSCSINLKGLFLISPLINGLVNGLANFCFQIGIIDSLTKDKLELMENQIELYIKSELWENASQSTNTMFAKLEKFSSANLYDFTKPPACPEENYVDFLEKRETREAIHVGNISFDKYGVIPHCMFKKEIPKSAVTLVEKLLQYYPIAFVSGQLDVQVAYPTVLNVLQSLNWSGMEKYSQAKRQLLVDENLWEDYGYYKSADNLKHVLIRGAGHIVPADQPRATLDLLEKFINDKL